MSRVNWWRVFAWIVLPAVLWAGMILLAVKALGAPTRVSVIARVYPDLKARELRRTPVSWNHLRRMARVRWERTHPAERIARERRMWIAHPTPATNRLLALLMFGRRDYECAKVIIDGESAWREMVRFGGIEDPAGIYSGLAYGLGQARPGTKMLAYGADAATNPATQLKWFRGYAVGRYGSICAAAAHWTPSRSW